ncbi:U3 small nucleolar RNA-associated protein 22 [Diplonema papillatum]|nr:U3 small nucleolar RNA-associated protein 22 [Diplonema papillatum]
MSGRDRMNVALLASQLKEVVHELKLAPCEALDVFLKGLQKTLTKEAPAVCRAEKVALVGSYLVDTCSTRAPVVDLYLTTPLSCCPADSVRQHGWVDARSVFLAELCKFLRSQQLVAEVVPVEGNFNKSVLRVTGPPVAAFSGSSPVAGSEHWTIRLHAGLRISSSILGYLQSPVTVMRSPFYSQLCLEDALLPELYSTLHETLGSFSYLTDLSKLAYLWAEKQVLTGPPDGLTQVLLDCFIHYLVKVQSLSEGLTIDAALRIVLQFLSVTPSFVSLTPQEKNSLSASSEAGSTTGVERMKQVSSQVTVFKGWNVWYNSSEAGVAAVRSTASASLALLDKRDAASAVETLFSVPSPFFLKYDMYAVLPYPDTVAPLKDMLRPEGHEATHDAAFTVKKNFCDLVHRSLKTALKNDLLDVGQRPAAGGEAVVFGIGLLATDVVKDATVIGPELRDRAAADAFLDLWGPAVTKQKQLQGAVRRAAVFSEAKSPHQLLRLILEALLRKLDLKGGIRVLGDGSSECLDIKSVGVHGEIVTYDAMDCLHFRLKTAFEELSTYMQKLDNFPLQFISIDGVHPALRKTAVAPPHPNSKLIRKTDPKINGYLVDNGDSIEAMEVVCSFSHTSAWPDHKEAIDHIKVALYCRLAQRLRKERNLVCIPRRDCVDVLLHGCVFRLYAYHPREILVLNALGLQPAAQAMRKQLELLPHHSDIIRGYAFNFTCYSACTRLLKRWTAAHLMDGYITEEALELIMAYVFSAERPPRSVLCGFARALHVIASWRWDECALVIPGVSGDVTDLPTSRPKGPAMWINTTYDSELSPFTRTTPNDSMLRRFQKLSEATLLAYFSLMKDNTADESWEGKWSSLFATSLAPYDMLITLDKSVVRNVEYALSGSKRKIRGEGKKLEFGELFRPGCATRRIELHRMINYDPVPWYLSTLRHHFREHALFAYDPYGGSVIAVVGLRAFTPEEARLLADHFEGMGDGIVKTVQTKETLQAITPAPAAAAEPAAKTKKAKKPAQKRTAEKKPSAAGKKRKLSTAAPAEESGVAAAVPAAAPKKRKVAAKKKKAA